MGGMFWAIDLDDFNNVFCGQGEYPLMNALKDCLTTYTGSLNDLDIPNVSVRSYRS